MKTRFIWSPDDFQISQCAFCQFKHEESVSCKAFPDGIPENILLGIYDHRLPYKGDHGIRFKPVKKVAKPI